MNLIALLGRSRICAVLAWLALASLGALSAARDPAAARFFDGAPQASVARALVDTPAHVTRIGAIKLTPWYRIAGDDRRDASGPDPLILPSMAATPLPVAIAGTIIVFVAGTPRFAGGGSASYAARAPPAASIR